MNTVIYSRGCDGVFDLSVCQSLGLCSVEMGTEERVFKYNKHVLCQCVEG